MKRREAVIAGLTSIAAVAEFTSRADAEPSRVANPNLDEIRALLRAHDEAFTNQDLGGIMACLAKKAVIMGTGPGEIWSGPDEIKVAYQHFFDGFDKGEQNFEYQFRIGDVTPDMGWMIAAGNVTGKKKGKEFAFPLNLSLTVARKDAKWLIVAMHFSTLTGAETQGTKDTQ